MSLKDVPRLEFTVPGDAHPHVQALIDFNRERCRKLLEIEDYRPVETIGIVGAGLMGTAIAAASIAGRLRVVLNDADPAALAHAAEQVRNHVIVLSRSLPEQVDAWLSERLVVTERLDELASCDLVLESITERADAKRSLYAEIEPRLADRAVLATNTSTIAIEPLAAGLRRPERFCGLHFFHPVVERPLVEIVRGPQTSASTLAALVGYAGAIGKLALVLDDGPGFVVNRLLMPYLTEAIELLLDGVSIERVEEVATRFGMAKGPLQLVDEIGLDTVVAGGRVLWQAFPQRIVLSPLMVAMYKAGRFGVKSGAGFFNYEKGAGRDERQSPGPNRSGGPETSPVAPPIDPMALAKIAEWVRTPQALDDEQIRDRLFLPMVIEATRLLEEGKVGDPRDVDLGVLFGLGFPAQRGGLLCWADAIGPAALVGRLGRLEALGPRMEPPALLRRMAAQGKWFYGGRDSTA